VEGWPLVEGLVLAKGSLLRVKEAMVMVFADKIDDFGLFVDDGWVKEKRRFRA